MGTTETAVYSTVEFFNFVGIWRRGNAQIHEKTYQIGGEIINHLPNKNSSERTVGKAPKRAKASAAAGVSAAHTVVAADSESDSDEDDGEADHAATMSEDEEETHLPAAVIQAIKSRAGRHIKAKNWFG